MLDWMCVGERYCAVLGRMATRNGNQFVLCWPLFLVSEVLSCWNFVLLHGANTEEVQTSRSFTFLEIVPWNVLLLFFVSSTLTPTDFRLQNVLPTQLYIFEACQLAKLGLVGSAIYITKEHAMFVKPASRREARDVLLCMPSAIITLPN